MTHTTYRCRGANGCGGGVAQTNEGDRMEVLCETQECPEGGVQVGGVMQMDTTRFSER